MEEVLLYFSLKYNGDFKKILKALQDKEVIDENLKIELFKKVKSKYVTIFSDDYPQELKKINCPPFVLYYYGDLSLLDRQTIGVVGTREPTEYGVKVTEDFVKELVHHDYVIVSGLAKGIDTVAHSSAINNNGKTVAVLGCGIDYCYPKQNSHLYEKMKENHLIISEYPFDIQPDRKYFPFRNRITAGLSKTLLVTECERKSGTMITVGYALEQDKYVYAVPSSVYGLGGCNYIIKEGAEVYLGINSLDF